MNARVRIEEQGASNLWWCVPLPWMPSLVKALAHYRPWNFLEKTIHRESHQNCQVLRGTWSLCQYPSVLQAILKELASSLHRVSSEPLHRVSSQHVWNYSDSVRTAKKMQTVIRKLIALMKAGFAPSNVLIGLKVCKFCIILQRIQQVHVDMPKFLPGKANHSKLLKYTEFDKLWTTKKIGQLTGTEEKEEKEREH